MRSPRTTRKRRPLDVEPLRFAHALRHLSPELQAPWKVSAGAGGTPTVHVDIIRPADLVALSIDAVGCELAAEGDSVVLKPRAGETKARLVVRYPFQHLAEEAIYEAAPGAELPVANENDPFGPPLKVALPTPDPNARPKPPIPARAARGSRLVFEIPANEAIPFSTEGLLAAIGRLKPAVHKLALPGEAPQRAAAGLEVRIIPLPGGLVGRLRGEEILVARPSAKERRQIGAPSGRTLAAEMFEARSLRRARRLVQSHRVSLDKGVRLPKLLGAGVDIEIGERLVSAGPIVGRPVGPVINPIFRRPTLSYPPKADETAIEAPYRLIISPSEEARWAHALAPVAAEDAPGHVELWHSRLGQAAIGPDGTAAADEQAAGRRIVRAVWTRDRDTMAEADWKNPLSANPQHLNDPFRMSLDAADRHMIVRQSAETLAPPGGSRRIPPTPIAARALWLSGLGAWLDLHGAWDTDPYSGEGIRSILAWDHEAPMGRDQYVRVEYPGYLYCLGVPATLVKLTERKMKDAAPSLAGLYQHKFLEISEPYRSYGEPRDLMCTSAHVGPRVTPMLDDPGADQDRYFWPSVGGQPFLFHVDFMDHDDRPVTVPMPLLWVAAHYRPFANVDKFYANDPKRMVQAHGQRVAFAPGRGGGDTSLETAVVRFLGKAQQGTSTPRMSSADVLIPAVQKLSPVGPVPIDYHPTYKQKGFTGAGNEGELWARVLVAGEQAPEHPTDRTIPLPVLGFGAGASSGSDKAGGFLAPNLPIRGVSRLTGVVGDTTGMAKQSFDPKTYFANAAPKLFGLVGLDELAVVVESDLTRVPQLVSEVVGRAEALVGDIGRAAQTLADAVAEANKMLARAAGKPPEWAAEAQAAITQATQAKSVFDDLAAKLPNLLTLMKAKGKTDAAVQALYAQFKTQVADTVAEFKALAPKLPPFIGRIIAATAEMLDTVVLQTADFAEDLHRLVTGFAENAALARFRFEWKPRVANWPGTGKPVIEVEEDSLVIAVHGQVGLDGKVEAKVAAELRDFVLHLFADHELIVMSFDHLAFKLSGSGKPEIDIVMRDIGFRGVLGFVEDIKELIPLDGFSDPPNISVTAEGLTAGFSLALPDIAIGVFAITNLSLGADVQVPFLGKAVTVGFGFCSRERPFTIAVAFLGGGGWCCTRISADGLEVLEIGLEAGACIAVDFGVASGSVSAMVGVYIRLEAKAGSIAGYFRLRGEVEALAIVSVSIELYMELKYHFDSGKLVGRATITVNVSVLGLSKSISITAQRSFAGSNGDPSFKAVMVEKDGSSPAWSAYCLAFAGE